MSKASLYIFIDESGNFDFSKNGTKYFVMAALATIEPVTSSIPLQELKYKLLADGEDVECFHAAPDSQKVRDAVFKTIKDVDGISYHFVYTDKRQVPTTIRSASAFYAHFGKILLERILGHWLADQYQQIVVIFDKALKKNDQKAFLKSVKPHLKTLGKPYRIYFHQTTSDFNGQIADYGAWALYVYLSRSEPRPIESIQHKVLTSINILPTPKTK